MPVHLGSPMRRWRHHCTPGSTMAPGSPAWTLPFGAGERPGWEPGPHRCHGAWSGRCSALGIASSVAGARIWHGCLTPTAAVDAEATAVRFRRPPLPLAIGYRRQSNVRTPDPELCERAHPPFSTPSDRMHSRRCVKHHGTSHRNQSFCDSVPSISSAVLTTLEFIS